MASIDAEEDEGVVAVPHPALSLPQLLELEATCCRARKRATWWQANDKTPVRGPQGAIGRMLSDVLATRNKLVRERRLTQSQLRELVDSDIVSSGFNEFLAGDPTGDEAVAFAWGKTALVGILTGGREIQSIPENEEDNAEWNTSARKVCQRIVSFFFPRDKDRLILSGERIRDKIWFFDDEFRLGCENPRTSWEVAAELRSLAYYAKRFHQCRIVRVSDTQRFPQINAEGALDRTGEATIECLKNGVSVVYVFAKRKDGSPAEASFERFRQFAVERLAEVPEALNNLQCVELGLDQRAKTANSNIFVGAYFNPSLRWALYEHRDGDELDNVLIVSRRTEHGSSAFTPATKEVTDFTEWVAAFVDPELSKPTEPAKKKSARRRANKSTSSD
jgi:hypothetical protein